MIELHFHCLPGIDDGPETWDEAVALCRAAADEGTETIVATPHVLRDPWLNEDAAERDRLLLRLNSLLGGRPSILPGCEYLFSADAVELWEMGSSGPIVGLNRGSYLLVELPSYAVPAAVDSVFHELSVMNVTPVIAHPERNVELARKPERLASLIARGAIVQVTAAAVTGEMGRNVTAAVDDFFDRGLVHIVASDAHSLKRRPPRLAAARERVEQKWGSAIAKEIFEANAEAVLRGAPLLRPQPSGTLR